MKLSVLAVGTDSDHMIRYIKYCDEQNDKDIQIDVFLTSINAPKSVFNRQDDVYGVSIPGVVKPLLRIPRVRDSIKLYYQKAAFKKLLCKKHYSLVCIHQLKTYTLTLTEIAKKYGAKVMLTPWGSDVLRASDNQKRCLKKAFDISDYVSSDLSVGFTDKFVRIYDVSRAKLVDAWYGSDVLTSIHSQKENYDKSTIASEFGMPINRYYITCGYAANRAQRHINMIDAVGKNKALFPKQPILVFPFTYGPDKLNDYQKELIEKCSQYRLDYCFVKDYMSIEKVARLRLLSDLYFHILPTDAYSASLIEYLLAGSICINGKWLDYPSLERFQTPYYLCEKLSELPNVVEEIYHYNNPSIKLLKETENTIMAGGWDNQIINWYKFFHSIINN